MEWNDISEEARETMKSLGDFGPTVRAENKELKGYVLDDEDGGAMKCYCGSKDLRNMAAHFIEVADWLDKRASLAESSDQPK